MSAENDARLAKALKRAGWVEPPPAPASPFDGLKQFGRALFQPSESAQNARTMAMNPVLSFGILASSPRFAEGVNDPLPDNDVPDFAKGLQRDLRAPEGSRRREFGDWLSRPQDITDSASPFGAMPTAMVRQQVGALINDPVDTISEFSGYAPLSRANDAFVGMRKAPDPSYAMGRMVRAAGEGGMGLATVAGNAFGAGSMASKAFRGLRAPVAPPAEVPEVISRTRDWAFKNMPPLSDDWASMRGQFDDALANADGVNPDLARAYFQDNIERARDVGMTAGPGDAMGRKAAAAGVRAAEAEALRKPNLWDGLDAQPAPEAAPQPARSPFAGLEPESALTAMSRAKTGGRADVLANPTPEQIFELRSKLASQGRNTALKYQMGPDGTAYVFPTIDDMGQEVAHASIARDMGFDKTLSDLPKGFIDGQNELDAFVDTARDFRQANRPALGAVDQAAKAAKDEELMRLAQAIEEAPDEASRAAAHAAFNDLLTSPMTPKRGPTVLGSNFGNMFSDDGPSVFEGLGNLFSRNRKVSANAEPTFRASEPNFTFGGQRAATADTAALAKAQELDAAGAPREQIWSETGWFKGVDGKWRFEIDDSGARLSDAATSDLDRLSEYTGTLKSGFDHQELFDAYPSLAPERFDAYTVPFQRGARFQEAGSAPYTAAGGPSAASIRSATLHESMHGVQGAEGFATGSSYKRVMENPELRAEAFAAARENLRPVAFEDYAAKWDIPDTPYARADHASLVKQQQQALQNLDALEQKADWTGQTDVPQALKNATDTLYRRHAGEVEARNVQTRRDWAPDQRRETPPWMSQDVPDDQQIVTFGNGVAESNILGSNAGNVFEGLEPRRVGRPAAGSGDTPYVRDYMLARSDGMTNADIASEFGVDTNNVKVSLSQARKSVQRALDAGEPVEVVAERYGVSPDVIQNLLEVRPAGRPGYGPGGAKMTDAVNEIMQSLPKGETLEPWQIAERLRAKGFDGATEKSVYSAIQALKGKRGRGNTAADIAKGVTGAGAAIAIPALQYKATENFQNANDPFAGLDRGM